MAKIRTRTSGSSHISTRTDSQSSIGSSSGMPKYVGARAVVDRVEGGVRITLTDYQGTTQEIVAEAIEDIVTNDDGSLTFTLADGREITTDSLIGPQGEQGPQGIPGEDGYTPIKGVDYFDGQDGQDGADGFSPIAAVSKTGDTATISITDANGTTTATVSDGVDGQDGSDGADGADGNGIVSITKIGSAGLVDTYKILFTNGTFTTFDVTNGQNGSGSVVDVWQNGVSVLDGDTAKVIVPTKVSDLTNDSGYITGYTETDPTVPSWAKASTKPSYTASEVGAVDVVDPMIALDTTASSGTDHDIYTALVALGWTDVIV